MSDIYQEEIKNCCRQLRLSANLAERAQTTSGETNQTRSSCTISCGMR